jgi:zinc transport system substrate-binding protein
MNSQLRIIIVILLLSAVLLIGCGQDVEAESFDTLHITVSILPQKYFVERIGGERVRVNVMVEPGASPTTYEPSPKQLRELTQSDVYMCIGVPFENVWLDRISTANSAMLIVDTAQDIERMPLGSGTENLDPHIWLSPQLVKTQARTIYKTLVQLDPDHVLTYRFNLGSFLADVDALDADIRRTLDGVKHRRFIVFHPAWGYFARDYGLEMIPVEVGGQEPSAAELAALVSKAKQENIKVIFAQPEFSAEDAKTIAQEINGRVLFISPLASDWLCNLRQVADTFAEVLDE